MQAGKQFEWLTGGYINCGYHEVIYTQKVKEARDEALKNGRVPWRISSTLFSHVDYATTLEPLGKFRNEKSLKDYPPISAKDHAMQ